MLDRIRLYQDELKAIRHDLHIHPELGLAEHRTAAIVADYLEKLGIEVHRGIGKTGVVGVLRKGTSNRSIGLRADMDALPIAELTGLPYASQSQGHMHACGHDGHTTMLLGAARYLAETGDFDGTVNLIFQPGEEGCGGALAMIEDRLFERFPCDAVFALHNEPGLEIGRFRIASGAIAAGGVNFDITIEGKGGHGALPQDCIDPVLAACHVVTALQSIISRNLHPARPAVLSVTKITAGDAYNVIPHKAVISGTARFFDRKVGEEIAAAMARVADGVAQGFGAKASMDHRLIFAPLVNDEEMTGVITEAARAVVGDANVATDLEPSAGSEDFSFMTEKVPGAYILLGNGDSQQVHHPMYDFNDGAIPYGSALFAALARHSPGT